MHAIYLEKTESNILCAAWQWQQTYPSRNTDKMISNRIGDACLFICTLRCTWHHLTSAHSTMQNAVPAQLSSTHFVTCFWYLLWNAKRKKMSYNYEYKIQGQNELQTCAHAWSSRNNVTNDYIDFTTNVQIDMFWTGKKSFFIALFMQDPILPKSTLANETIIQWKCALSYNSSKWCQHVWIPRQTYSILSSVYSLAASLLAGLLGFGSSNKDCIDASIPPTLYVGLHRFCNISKQMPPSAYTGQKIWTCISTKLQQKEARVYFETTNVGTFFSEWNVVVRLTQYNTTHGHVSTTIYIARIPKCMTYHSGGTFCWQIVSLVLCSGIPQWILIQVWRRHPQTECQVGQK